jgi:hypothetical protein
LVSPPNQSLVGQAVTLIASVTAPSPSSGTPTGNATFFDGATALGTVNVDSNGHAQFVTSSLSQSSHTLKATYNGDWNFLTSTSPLVTEQVSYTSTISGNSNSDLTVGSGQSVNVTSSGKVNGNATVKGGGVLSVNGGTINGNVTVQPGGVFFMNGGSVNGNITSTSATGLTLCGAQKINGNVSASGTSSYVLIGGAGAAGCAGNDINGSITLTNNTAGFEVSLNKVNGAITVTGNTTSGPSTADAMSEIEGNTKINGNLACSGNVPTPVNDGKPNSVNGTRPGPQCSATGF